MYRLIRQRHEQKSTMFTSNKEFPEWGKFFGEYAEAALDRILDKKYLILIKVRGESYRINPSRQI